MSHSALLVADGVRVEFGALVAVRDVSLELAGGQILGLIGPNGAGKTTLLRALAGLIAPTAGTVTIMGFDVLGDSDDVRRHIGLAPDAPPVYDQLTVEDFLTFIGQCYGLGWSETSERMDYWLEQTWLSDRRHQKMNQLSRGMKQRVTIARTLMTNPNVVLLDEPSQGLDPAGRIQLRQVMANLGAQGKAVVVSSHILADLEEYCTDVAIIEHGSILRMGPVYALTGRARGRHGYRLVVAGGSDGAEAALRGWDGVTQVVRREGALVFEFDDDPVRAAQLLGHLVERGLAVAEFALLPDTLESTYLKAGVKQVD